jgi:hypothetical protein
VATILKSTSSPPAQKTIFAIKKPIATEDTVATIPGIMKL